MKKLFILTVFCSSLFASGKIQVKPSYSLASGKPGGQVGFSIYEKILGPLAWNQWIGIGSQPRIGEPSVTYVVSSQEVEMWINKVGVAVGHKFQVADNDTMDLVSDNLLYAKLSYQIW